MQAATTSSWLDRFTLLLLVTILAAPVTYLEITQPSWHQIRSDTRSITKLVSPAPKVTATPTLPATSVTTVHGTTAPPAQAKTATTSAPVNLRASKSVNSAILTQIPSGTSVQLGSDIDATWQSVTYQGKSGYIYRAYLEY